MSRRRQHLADHYYSWCWLPASSMPFGAPAKIRTYCSECLRTASSQTGAYFGTGSKVRLGRIPIGENARIEHDVVIEDDVMMGIEVMVQQHATVRTYRCAVDGPARSVPATRLCQGCGLGSGDHSTGNRR